MSDHLVSVGAVARPVGTGGTKVAPAFRWRCSCGAESPAIVALGVGAAKVNEARAQAQEGGIAHQREARRLEARESV